MKKIIFTLIMLINLNTINAANENTILESLGFISATKVMVTAYGLGSAYDAWITDAYNDEEFEDVVLFYQQAITGTREQLNTLYRYGDLLYDDKEYIAELIEIYDALHEQSRTALKYSYTKKDLDFNAYTNARSSTIDKMNNLFELNWE